MRRATADPATAEPRWLDPHEQDVWRAFLDMYAGLMARLGRELQETCGLSNPEFSVLVQLSEHVDGRQRVLELARSLRWEKSRLSHQLSRMQQRGLIARSECTADRRGAFVVITDQGRAAIEAAAPRHVESVRRYLFDELTDKQVDQLGEIARSVVHRLESGCTGRDCDAAATGCDEPVATDGSDCR